MIDTSLIRPECLYDTAEAADLCGRADTKSFLSAMKRGGFRAASESRSMLWLGSTLLRFLGVPDGRPSFVPADEAMRQIKAIRAAGRRGRKKLSE